MNNNAAHIDAMSIEVNFTKASKNEQLFTILIKNNNATYTDAYTNSFMFIFYYFDLSKKYFIIIL